MKTKPIIILLICIVLAGLGCKSTFNSSEAFTFGTRELLIYSNVSSTPIPIDDIPEIKNFLGKLSGGGRSLGFTGASITDTIHFLDTQANDTRRSLGLGSPLPTWTYGAWVESLQLKEDYVSFELEETSILELALQLSWRTDCPLIIKMRRIQYEDFRSKVDEVRPYLMMMNYEDVPNEDEDTYFIGFDAKRYTEHLKVCESGSKHNEN